MIKDLSSDKFKYILYTPNAPNPPLIVILHGSGEIGSSLSKLKKREPYLSLSNGKCKPAACILMPQLPKGTWGDCKAALKTLIDRVAAEHGCSSVSISGHSLGANGTLDMLLTYPGYFRAASVLSPCKDIGDKVKAFSHIPVWFLAGEKENNYRKYAVSMNDRLNRLGGASRLTLVPGYGHPIQFTWVSANYKMFDWLTQGKTTDKGGEAQMFTGRQLAEYCERFYANRGHWAYWYGTYGNKCTMSKYESKKKQYPGHYGSSRTSGYMKDIEQGRRCADCVGMIKSFFWTGDHYDTDPKYATNGCPDTSANGMIKLCKETGPISTIPDIHGVVVWKDGHIGVYVGGGYTVEMRGFDYDCVRRKVKDGPWKKWGKLPMLNYNDAPKPVPEPSKLGDRDLRRGCKGEDVEELQRDLIKLGYSLPKYGADGDFGTETDKAVKSFQLDHGLLADGVMQEDDFKALAAALNGESPAPVTQQFVEIIGNSVNVRSAPGTEGTRVLGVVHKGDRLPYQGMTKQLDWPWYLVEYQGRNAWVSGKYSKVVE